MNAVDLLSEQNLNKQGIELLFHPILTGTSRDLISVLLLCILCISCKIPEY